MTGLFLRLLNMSLAASWLVLAVLILRLLLKKTPKWITCLLWGLVTLRLNVRMHRYEDNNRFGVLFPTASAPGVPQLPVIRI